MRHSYRVALTVSFGAVLGGAVLMNGAIGDSPKVANCPTSVGWFSAGWSYDVYYDCVLPLAEQVKSLQVRLANLTEDAAFLDAVSSTLAAKHSDKLRGDKGEPGSQGVAGLKGETGAQGAKGDLGPQGPAGRDATAPTGIVVASTVACSALGAGWAEFTEAAGRFVIGVGQGTDRNAVSDTFSLNLEGGEYKHKLTEEEMPAHRHAISTSVGVHIHEGFLASKDDSKKGIDDIFSLRDEGPDKEGFFGPQPNVLQERGGSQPHPIMPPYIALYWCKKS